MRHRFRQGLAAQIEGLLEEQTASIRPLQDTLTALNTQVRALHKRMDRLQETCVSIQQSLEEAQGFHGKMTVHEAWARHPGVREVFTRHHLPHCDRCPVGEDERLEEAAFGYSMDLNRLLEELNALC